MFRPVGDISLNFSVHDKHKLTNSAMVQIAKEYMQRMCIADTQYIIGRHHEKPHSQIHIIFNRIDNNGNAISDKNDRYRSQKICKELTAKYGLYVAQSKENVNRHRLKQPDKTKYEIYDALNRALPQCKNWNELTNHLKHHDITISLKYKGNTCEIQGVRFSKNGYIFNGSKIDRRFSYSKINFQLIQNNKAQEHRQIKNEPQPQYSLSVAEDTLIALGGLFDMPTSGINYDDEQAARLRKKRRTCAERSRSKRGIRL
jgi:hypothetical protein